MNNVFLSDYLESLHSTSVSLQKHTERHVRVTVLLRIQCYVSVVTEKDDLPFQLTYYAFFLTFDFQTKNAERHALTLHVKSTMGSGIRTTYYNVLLTIF